MFHCDWLQRRELLSPSKIALIDAVNDNKTITYLEWNRRTNRLANFLRDGLRINKGDRISIYAMNCVEYLDTIFACNKLGAILQVLNWRLAAREVQAIINDATPKVLIYSAEFSTQVDELRSNLPSVKYYVCLDQVSGNTDYHWLAEYSNWPDTQPLPVELDWEDPWILCYTGGTTGDAKGAILNYRCITANSVNTVISWGMSPDDVVPVTSPLFHTGGLNVMTLPMIHLGGTNIVCAGFDLDQFFDQIENMGITFFFAVPAMLQMMIQHPRWSSVDMSGIRLVMAGGGACPTVVYKAFWEKGVNFKGGYGLTEAGPNTFWIPSEYKEKKIGSVGRPLFHIDVKMVDAHGQEVGVNEVGHLLIRGPHVFGGYWNLPQVTAETIVDGWLHTGDLARRDEDGDHYIVGRLKHMIKSGGENIYPIEVEDVMLQHPAIAEAALISVPDEKWGEVGRAIIVLKDNAKLSEFEFIKWMREHIAVYKVPKSIVFVSELPKTGSNKINKKILFETYGEGIIENWT